MLDLVVEDRQKVRHNTVCTATRIARDLLMTNYHCVPGREYKTVGVQARFGFLDPQAAPGRLFGVELKPVESSLALDYAILKLAAIPSETEFPPVALKRHVATDGESLILIHHPMGHAQRMTRFRCLAGSPAFSEGRLVHHCDTLGGSSGSAVFTQDGLAFAGLHFAGVPSPDRPFNIAQPAADLFAASATLRGLEGVAATVAPAAPSAADRLAEARKRYDSGKAAYDKKDYLTARLDWQAACDGGHALGCSYLGFLYDEGLGVTQDYAAARRFHQQGCDGGNARGCTDLGIFTHGGFGGPKNEAEGIRLVRKGCASGNQWGCDWLSERGISRN